MRPADRDQIPTSIRNNGPVGRNQEAQARKLSAVKEDSLIEVILAFLGGGANNAVSLTFLGLFTGNLTLTVAAFIAMPLAMAAPIHTRSKRTIERFPSV